MRSKLLIGFVFCFLCAPAQEMMLYTSHIGFNAGLNAAFGTHFRRLGVTLNFFYRTHALQANSEIRAYFNFKTLGPTGKYPELCLSQGLVVGYGKPAPFFNSFLSVISNQTGYSNSISYAYNFWLNKRNTSQQTGIIALQFHQISFISENDILARRTLDRFRTAAFLIQYQYENTFQAAVNCSMWTGAMGRRQEINHSRIYAGCYMDTVGGLFPNTSHGLLSLQVKYHAGYSQVIQANAGIDAEQVRNTVQNKIIHDMRFIPDKWNKKKNCHIPMLDENNTAFLYRENQKIRRASLFLNVFSNANIFY